MASKSVGQIVGTVVGAVIGFFAGGNVALGAAIGGAIGGLIDPPKGPTIVGPRLDDLSFQTSTLGAPLGRAYGTVPVLGNVVWLEGDKYREVITSDEQGGKGGSSATYETAHYYATFAVSLLRVTDATKTIALRRMWIGSNLVYDAGSDNIESVIASNAQSPLFTFYSGSDDQQPNPRWQADKGINAVSGFPGRCYIVIYDLDLEPYSRSLAMAQVKVELAVGSSTKDVDAAELVLPQEINYFTGSLIFNSSGAEYTRVLLDGLNFSPIESSINLLKFSDTHDEGFPVAYTDIAGGTNGYGPLSCTDTDVPISVIQETYLSLDNKIITIIGGVQEKTFLIPNAIMYHGGPWFCCYSSIENMLYIFNGGYSHTIIKISPGSTFIDTISPASHTSRSGGLSENYLFIAAYQLSGTTTTIYRLKRSDLSLDETWVGNIAPYNTTIQVVDDETIYTASSSGNVHKWVSGVVVADLGTVVTPTLGDDTADHPGWFKVISESPPYVLSHSTLRTLGIQKNFYIGHDVVAQSVAKLHDIVTAECGLAGLSSGDIDLTGLTNSDVRGFRIAQAGPVRSSLEMMQAAFPFDVAPSGYKLRFVSRGGASLATVTEADLGTTSAGSATPALLPVAREMDTQIPYKVSVRYLDPAREYDIAEQYASRPDTASVSERTVELSLVMTAEEAVQAADVLNQKDWLERVSFGPFTVPPAYSNLEPPDVITIEHRGQSHEVRLTRAEFMPDGRIECAAVLSKSQAYTSSSVAQESLTIGQILVPLAGSTSGYLLDIPRIRSEQDVPGMSFALTGLASGWPGGVLLRSDDSGATWQAIGASNSRAKVFTTGSALAAHHGHSMDHVGVLTATPRYSGHTLSSLTELQLFAHGNLAAYGADGRWEIVAFMTVTDNTGSYAAQNFLRGLYGTEQYTGTHVDGDLLIMLDTATTSFFGLPTNAIGAARIYRAVTQGAAIDSAVDMADTYDGANIKPLSPVEMRGWRHQTTKDWTLIASSRTRTPVELFSGVATPSGETSEAYEIEFWNSDFTTLKRTISGLSTPGCSYTSAQQIADFGIEQSTLYYKLFKLSSIIGRGYPLSGSITRTIAADPYGEFVILLRHMDDTGLTDVKGHTVTLTGNAARSAVQSKFGGYSAVSDGTGDDMRIAGSSDFNVFVGDFTYEFWFYVSSNTPNQCFVEWYVDSSNRANVSIVSGNIVYYSSTTAGGGGTRISFAAPTAGAWHYGVLKKSGTTITLQADLVTGTTTSNIYPTGTPALYSFNSGTGGSCVNGYIDEDRLTKGYCRDTSVIPTAAFPNP